MHTKIRHDFLKALRTKLKDALVSVLPVTLIVLILSLTPLVDLTVRELVVFSVSGIILVIGIALFNLGADIAMTPMGQHIGESLTKSRRVGLLIAFAFVMGLLITVAEPDLSVLASQVKGVMDSTALIIAVGVGVGLCLVISVLKILFGRDLSPLLMFFYMMLFSFAAFLFDGGKGSFLPLSFDSGGVTTGPITVPFIMAFGVGIALTAGGKHAGENSFGLIALCSIGPVIAVLALSATAEGSLAFTLPDYSLSESLGDVLPELLFTTMSEVGRSLLLIMASFLILQVTLLRLPRRRLIQIAVGILYTFIGLVLFLCAVNIGFMPIGYRLGTELAGVDTTALIIIAFIIGTVVVLAEPAVHVLKHQVSNITNGEVSPSQMSAALAIGVGISIALSAIRIIFGFSLLLYLIPGYLLSMGLSFFVPHLYTAMAFDSGGVASGPLTSGFILPLTIGACVALRGEAEVLNYAFGVVAMVAMTPLITIQLLGFKSVVAASRRYRMARKRIVEADDAQIIYFE